MAYNGIAKMTIFKNLGYIDTGVERVCKSLVGLFPVDFPLVGVEDGTEGGDSVCSW